MQKMRILSVGVVGLGTGRRYLSALAELPYARLVAICDTDEAKLKRYADEYDYALAYTDYNEMLASADLDVVCVCTPDHFHRDMVLAAFEKGLDVICEKPLALHADECEEMLLAAKKAGRVLSVGQVCRFTPAFVKAKEMVDAGLIGELSFVESEYAHDYSHMGACWRSDPAVMRHGVTGGGCHAVDLLRFIAGNPTEAFAYSNKKTLTDWPCDDTAIGVLKFPNNVIGKVFVSTGCKRGYTMRTLLYGTKGTIIVDNTSSTMSLFLERVGGVDTLVGAKMKDIEMKIPVTPVKHNVRDELKVFFDAVLNGAENTIKGEEGAATVAVCEALIKSCETGKPETIQYDT